MQTRCTYIFIYVVRKILLWTPYKTCALQISRAANPEAIADAPLYRNQVDPDHGGKAPESALLRAELNRVDAMGLNEDAAQQMVDSLKDMPLPEKASPPEPAGPHSGFLPHRPHHLAPYHQPG